MSVFSAKKKSRSLDRTVIQAEGTEHEKRIEEFHELGEKFKEDKEKWEDAYDTIEADDSMDRKEKIAQLRALKQEIEETKEKYEEQVAELEEVEIQEMQGNIEEMNELAEKLDSQADKLEGLKKVTDNARSDASTEARDRAEKAKAWASSQAELLQSRIDKFKNQAQSMRNNRH